MKRDLKHLLETWPYDTENPENNFRLIRGEDRRLVIQVREPLGIQQMNYRGRPDGFRPHGVQSWLEYFQGEAERDPAFRLSDGDCLLLMQEGILYYQRYLVLYQMDDWRAVVRDTQHNLDYFDFTAGYAENVENSLTIEQYRPYLMRMNAIARSRLLWRERRFEEAIALLKDTRRRIEHLAPLETEVFDVERERAVQHLDDQVAEYEQSRPESPLERLMRLKVEAVRSENFELAARLRDEIRQLEARGVRG